VFVKVYGVELQGNSVVGIPQKKRWNAVL